MRLRLDVLDIHRSRLLMETKTLPEAVLSRVPCQDTSAVLKLARVTLA